MTGTVTKKWANTNIVWESNPELVDMLYKLIVQTKKEQVVVRILKDDFGRVYIGELTDEDFAKYKSILARATTTYTDEHWAGTGLTLTRSVDYRNPLYKNID